MLINKVNQAPTISTASSNYIQQEKPNTMQPFGPAATFRRSDKADYDTNKLSGTQKSIMNIQEQIAQVKTDDTLSEGIKQGRIEALEEQLQNLEMQLSQEQMEKANPKNKEQDADQGGQNPLNAAAEKSDLLKDANPMNDDLNETAIGMLSITQNVHQMELTKTTMGAAAKAERHVQILQSETKLDRNPSDGKKQSILDAKQQAQEATAVARKMMERSGELIQDSAKPMAIEDAKGMDKEIDKENTNNSKENGKIAGLEDLEEDAIGN